MGYPSIPPGASREEQEAAIKGVVSGVEKKVHLRIQYMTQAGRISQLNSILLALQELRSTMNAVSPSPDSGIITSPAHLNPDYSGMQEIASLLFQTLLEFGQETEFMPNVKIADLTAIDLSQSGINTSFGVQSKPSGVQVGLSEIDGFRMQEYQLMIGMLNTEDLPISEKAGVLNDVGRVLNGYQLSPIFPKSDEKADPK
jgi:hypothetical protein